MDPGSRSVSRSSHGVGLVPLMVEVIHKITLVLAMGWVFVFLFAHSGVQEEEEALQGFFLVFSFATTVMAFVYLVTLFTR